MTLAIPCDACGTALRHDVVTVRFATSRVSFATAGHTRTTPNRREEYLVCTGCASYLQACIAVLEARVAAEPLGVREMVQ